jgi:hypothetical protein
VDCRKGRPPNPSQDVGGSLSQGGNTLAQYYSGEGGLRAGIDTSGRGYIGQPGGQGESLATSQAAVNLDWDWYSRLRSEWRRRGRWRWRRWWRRWRHDLSNLHDQEREPDPTAARVRDHLLDSAPGLGGPRDVSPIPGGRPADYRPARLVAAP